MNKMYNLTDIHSNSSVLLNTFCIKYFSFVDLFCSYFIKTYQKTCQHGKTSRNYKLFRMDHTMYKI